MVELDKETQKKIQNLQILEQTFQTFLIQKQNFQLELNETITALEEVEKSKSDVFKILGQVMVKANKDELKKELSEKKTILEKRINSIEKQEKTIREDVERMRGEIVDKIH